MDAITLSAIVSEDRKLVVELPPEIPIGPVEVVIRPKSQVGQAPLSITREWAQAKLLAAGLLVTSIHAPEEIVPLSPEELLRIGRLAPGARPSEDLINEDRGDY